MSPSLALIVSPFHVGVQHRVGNGPLALLPPLQAAFQQRNVLFTVSIISPAGIDSFEGEIGRSFEVLRRIKDETQSAIKRGDFPIILAGNCHSTVAVAAAVFAVGKVDPTTTDLFYIDAHPDAQTPSNNTNGYLDAMGTAMLAGMCWEAQMEQAGLSSLLPLEQITYIAARNVPEAEKKTIEDAGSSIIYGDKHGVEYKKELTTLLKKRSADRPSLVHFDLDSLDPAAVGHANEFPEEGGLLAQDAVDVLSLLAKRNPLSLTVASFNPACERGENVTRVAVEAVLQFVELL
jgi:arginase